MGPAEIVASLKELCAEKGPRLTTEEIVAWIEQIGGYETDAELVAFAKKMKARQYARMLEFEDEDSGLRIKRLWSFHDEARGRRFYADILELPDEQRKRLIRQYAKFVKQLRAVRKAMADYFAGQRFFDFYPGEPEEDEADEEVARPRPVPAAVRPERFNPPARSTAVRRNARASGGGASSPSGMFAIRRQVIAWAAERGGRRRPGPCTRKRSSATSLPLRHTSAK